MRPRFYAQLTLFSVVEELGGGEMSTALTERG